MIYDLGFVYGLAEKLLGLSLRAHEKIIILASAASVAVNIDPDVAFEMCEKGSDLTSNIMEEEKYVIQELLSSFFLFLNDKNIHNSIQKRTLVMLALSWCRKDEILTLVHTYERLELDRFSTKVDSITDRKFAVADSLRLFKSSFNFVDIEPLNEIDSGQLMDCFLDLDHVCYSLGLNGGIDPVEGRLWDEAIIELAKLVNFSNPVLSICFLFHLKDV